MRFLVAVPIFNEAATVVAVLSEIRQVATDILVVDDGSTDGTAALLAREPGIQRIHHRRNLGYGQSLIDAFRYAVDHDYDWLITLDCDEQHEPSQIPQFMAAAARDDADILSGSRYLPASRVRSTIPPPTDRQAINQTMTALLNKTLQLSITDAFCGFKAYRVENLSQLDLTEPGYGMPIQLWVQAAQLGLRIREVPVSLIYKANRQFGNELDNPTHRLLYYYQVLTHAMREKRTSAETTETARTVVTAIQA
ncbi:MAG: glycosyltransferase family 2 protein [Phycisphaerae bacterium]|nr:glycosyltransferase family 2 protein [Phycisphaerae bacterium]